VIFTMSQPSKTTTPARLSRPAMIGRPASIGSQSRDTTSTSASALSSGSIISRPISLLAGLQSIRLPDDPESAYTTLAPPRPRRLWKVSDTAIPSVPELYPPLDRRCTAYVSDAPPSVVAVRVSEALRLRGVSAEYDEEAGTATCMTVDRCHFIVHLWRGKSRDGASVSSGMNTSQDLSFDSFPGGSASVPISPTKISLDGVLVECVRVRGSVLTFHRTVQAVLQAAKSHDSGRDVRPSRQLAPTEWGRQQPPPRQVQQDHVAPVMDKKLLPPTKSSKTYTIAALEALEHALQLLRKDRLQPQILAMESLVALTDPETSGLDTAMYVALAVLGAHVTATEKSSQSSDSNYFLTEIHEQWIMQLVVERQLPGEAAADAQAAAASASATADASFSFACPLGGVGGSDNNHNNLNESSEMDQHQRTMTHHTHGSLGDEDHGGMMRALALRAFSNALDILDREQPKVLKSILASKCPHLTATPLLRALVEDVQGAHRPPAVVAGTRLASQHEAVLAIRCLRLLGTHSPTAKQHIISSDDTLCTLQKAKEIGSSTHQVLAEEADMAYSTLTEEDRSC
jgi:hypothetical protein